MSSPPDPTQPEEPLPPTTPVDRPRSCVVVGYDGSPAARNATVWAARRVAPDGKVVLVHACRPLHRWLPALSTAVERKDRGRALLDELFLDGDEALFRVRIEAKVLNDDPVHALLSEARRQRAEEIVIGTHRHTTLDPLQGDVAAELVRTAPVPVCVVPVEVDEGADSVGE